MANAHSGTIAQARKRTHGASARGKRGIELIVHSGTARRSRPLNAPGYKFANVGRDTRALQRYFGRRNIMHTVRYTEHSPQRFRNFWEG